MKDYFCEKFKKSKSYFDRIGNKVIVRMWNLARRMDLGHSRREKKKKKKGD